MGVQRSFAIEHISSVAAVRREALYLAAALDFDEVVAGRLGLIITEVVTNIIRHAGAGELLLRGIDENGERGCEMIAIDRGPGIADVGLSMRDGHSTRGTPGSGLGAMQRLADQFALYSRPGQGTVVYLAVFGQAQPRVASLQIGVVSLPKPGEECCGDGWHLHRGRHSQWLALADGLGHGPDAAAAARAALGALAETGGVEPVGMIQMAHERSRSTRGSALSVAVLQPDSQRVLYVGVGNVSCCVVGGERRHSLRNSNGTIGVRAHRIHADSAPWPADATVILHSDGIGSQWDLGAYPGLAMQHPALIAAVLYRDFARGTDDVTIVAVRRVAGRVAGEAP